MKRYQRIEDLRKDKDWNQEEMAKRMNTSKTQYQRYENSDGNNFFEAMITIAKIHNVSLDYIAGLTNSKGGLHKNNDEEKAVLSIYNSLSEFRKGRIMQLLTTLEEEQKAENAKNKDVI